MEPKTRQELLEQLAKGLWEARSALFQLQALDPRTEEERDALEDAVTKLAEIGGDDWRPDHSSGLLSLLTSEVCGTCSDHVGFDRPEPKLNDLGECWACEDKRTTVETCAGCDEVEDSTCVNGTEWCELDGHLCADCAADRADYAHDSMEGR